MKKRNRSRKGIHRKTKVINLQTLKIRKGIKTGNVKDEDLGLAMLEKYTSENREMTETEESRIENRNNSKDMIRNSTE